MAQDDKKPSGPDLAQGIAVIRSGRRRHADGPCRRRRSAAGAPGRQGVRHRRPLHALSWAARRRAGGRQHHPLSLASRLFRSGDRRSAGRARAQPAHLLAGRGARRQDRRRREDRARRRPRKPDRRPSASSSSAAARPDLPRPRCCGGAALPATSRCSATTMPRRSTAPICRRIISPAARRRTGCRCAATTGTPTTKST